MLEKTTTNAQTNAYTHYTHLRNNITNTMMITISNTASMTPTTPPIIGPMEGRLETIKKNRETQGYFHSSPDLTCHHDTVCRHSTTRPGYLTTVGASCHTGALNKVQTDKTHISSYIESLLTCLR